MGQEVARGAFARLVAERRHLEFRWGERDCCLWAADAVRAMTGRDFAADLRGYSSQFGALRALRRAGYRSVAELIADRLRPAPRASFGAVVLMPGPPLDALLVADGSAACWGQDELGLVRLPIPPAATLWST
jgi:hypothetical protein